MRRFRHPHQKLVAGGLCLAWVVLTLIAPCVASQKSVGRETAACFVDAVTPVSTAYADTSVDESSTKPTQASIRLALSDAVRLTDCFSPQTVRGRNASTDCRYGVGQPTLLDLGIALRL